MPDPRRSAGWWKRQDTIYDGGAIESVRMPRLINEDSWMIQVSMDQCPGNSSSFPVFFATATDCLLWFRWQAIPYCERQIQQVELDPDEATEQLDFMAQLAKRMDSATERSDAGRLLISLKSSLLGLFDDLELSSIQPIHPYLAKLGSAAAWRKALQNNTVTFKRGRWSMSPKAWTKLGELLESVMSGECDAIDPEYVRADEEA